MREELRALEQSRGILKRNHETKYTQQLHFQTCFNAENVSERKTYFAVTDLKLSSNTFY